MLVPRLEIDPLKLNIILTSTSENNIQTPKNENGNFLLTDWKNYDFHVHMYPFFPSNPEVDI
jgi:hypothetical protein